MPDFKAIEKLQKHVKAIKKLDEEILSIEQLLTQVATEDCIIKFSVEQLSNNSGKAKDEAIVSSEDYISKAIMDAFVGMRYPGGGLYRIGETATPEYIVAKPKSNVKNRQFSINSQGCILMLRVIFEHLKHKRELIILEIEKITGSLSH